MRDCKRHPGSQSQPGGGVCASCLRERLVWLWRGESFRLDDDDPGDEAQAPARPALVDIASVRKQLQVNGVATKPDPRNNSDAQAATTKKPDVIVEWAEFHAQRRRRNLELESSSSSGSPSMAQISRSLDSLEFKRLMVDNADRSYRSRSMPLDNRSAEETALRVIREVQQADDHLDELDFLDDGGLQMLPEQLQQRRIHRRRSIFFWQSPKWMMKLLVMSPATTSGQNNKKKVFPSRVGSRKRLTRFNSSDWSHTDENWMVSSLQEIDTRKVDDMEKHQRRTNVLSWLQQDADRTRIRKYVPTGMSSSFSSSSGSTDSCHRDLTTVGHLHEIAEELEEEDEVVPTDSLGDISSFGIFLLSAAQRQPQAGLTRISSAA